MPRVVYSREGALPTRKELGWGTFAWLVYCIYLVIIMCDVYRGLILLVSGFTVSREVDVATPMDTTLTTLTRFPRVLIRTSPETFLWGMSRDQLHDIATC